MLTELAVPPFTVRGISVGGVYTSLLVPELDSIFDAGAAPRSFVGASRLFLSHSHADHAGALPALLGQRGLSHSAPPTIFLPREMEEDTRIGVSAFNRGQRHPLEITYVPVDPGDEIQLERDLWVRVFRTRHTIPSVGYYLFRRVEKLRDEFLGHSSSQLAQLRKSGADVFRIEERGQLAYVTDTLIDVLDENPELYRPKVLILECTFIDEKKTAEATRQKYHIHLEEIVERCARFTCEHLVLMHFSQSYAPQMLRGVLKARLPPELYCRVQALAPRGGPWPG